MALPVVIIGGAAASRPAVAELHAAASSQEFPA